jgi:hypothetical protein
MGDAITLLSKNWTDTNSTGPPANSRVGANTTINACLVAGNTTSSGGTYGGGAENFVRYLENWNKTPINYFTYYGSMVQLFRPQQAIGAWTGAGSVYSAPALLWHYDDNLLTAGAPPGNLDVAAYLQQQRWYQVY